MKKVLITVLTVAMVLGIMSFTVFADGNIGVAKIGDSYYDSIEEAALAAKANDVIVIYSNIEDIAAVVNSGKQSFNKITIKLANDFDLNNEEWTPIGSSTNKFQGIFDGNGHTISNLKINSTNSYIGLFGYTINGEIKNLTVHNADIDGRLGVGVISGCPYTSKFTDIKVTGHVTIDAKYYVGGVVGRNAYADLTNIIVDVDDTSYVKADSVDVGAGENGEDIAYRTYVGGVVGFMGEGGHKVANVKSNIDVIGSTQDVGGITGIAHYNNTFENCECSGNVTLTGYNDGDKLEVGGIAGTWHNQDGTKITMKNCYYTGAIKVTKADGTAVSGYESDAITGAQYSAAGTGELVIVYDEGHETEITANAVSYNDGTAAVAFNASYDKWRATNTTAYGMCIYKNSDKLGKRITVDVGDLKELQEAKGLFNIVLKEIPENAYEDIIVCVPYVIVGGEIVFGDVMAISVAELLNI